MMTYVFTGAELRAWRETHGLSVVQLAELAGVSDQTIRKFENGKQIRATTRGLLWEVINRLDITF